MVCEDDFRNANLSVRLRDLMGKTFPEPVEDLEAQLVVMRTGGKARAVFCGGRRFDDSYSGVARMVHKDEAAITVGFDTKIPGDDGTWIFPDPVYLQEFVNEIGIFRDAGATLQCIAARWLGYLVPKPCMNLLKCKAYQIVNCEGIVFHSELMPHDNPSENFRHILEWKESVKVVTDTAKLRIVDLCFALFDRAARMYDEKDLVAKHADMLRFSVDALGSGETK
jgi:hypothetical protein